ncbi:hypothetical protein GCM10009665_58270 [Kitasatospora nipponensis]|uniref:Uncharacterized protein n=1 Tax=Kitasatospora nipponensis TaxID=258049 RepID=A0ABN1WRD8_9ACTN
MIQSHLAETRHRTSQHAAPAPKKTENSHDVTAPPHRRRVPDRRRAARPRGVGTTASAASTYFVGTGRDAYSAGQSAWGQAYAAGYTHDQCDADMEMAAPHYWRDVVTCVS